MLRSALFIVLLCCAGCAQVSGTVHDERIVDLNPSYESPAACEARVLHAEDYRGNEREFSVIGVLDIEGSILMTREDAEELARSKACEHGATHIVLGKERYGTPFLGGAAQAKLLRPRP
jgi:hypothetical protein